MSTNKKRRPVIMTGLNDRKLAGGYLVPVPRVTLFEKAAEGRIVPAAPPTAEQV